VFAQNLSNERIALICQAVFVTVRKLIFTELNFAKDSLAFIALLRACEQLRVVGHRSGR
jgi:hypothetical protein